jgi:hypothetical protein
LRGLRAEENRLLDFLMRDAEAADNAPVLQQAS